MKKLILRFAFLAVVLMAYRGQATTYVPTIPTDPAVAGGVNAANGVITGGAGNGQVSLRSAIIAANAHAGADTITLPAGTYTLALLGNDATCEAGDLDINDSLTINGAGAATTIIQGATDAAFTGSIGDKIIGINQDGTHPSLAVGINNVTIRYGRNTIPNTDPLFAYTGAGVDVFLTGAGNSIGFTNCVISNNQNVNAYGGGVNVDSANGGVAAGTVTFNGCTIVSNSTMSTTFTATGAGVNLFADLHDVTFINCVIANNQAATSGTAGTGGGINIRHTNGGTVTVNNCVITNNAAIAGGGGILTAVKQTVNITGGRISGNSAGTGGGGLFCGTGVGTTTLNNVTISGNHANTSTGGGILDTATAALILNNCVITSNTAGTGGGIHVSGGNLSANYCRIVNNTATTGKAVAQTGGTASVANNWWGTNAPASLMSGTVGFTPWLMLRHAASPNTITAPNSTTLTATFMTNSAGTFISSAILGVLTGVPIAFNNAVLGTLSGAQATVQSSATATATFTGTAGGAGSADAVVDGQSVTAPITVNELPSIICPTDITVNAAGYCVPSLAFGSTVTAGFPAPTVAYKLGATTITSPYAFPIGTNIVTSTATNVAGTNSCSFTVTVFAGAAPQLNIVRAGTNVVVSWPNAFPCYTLQFAPALASNRWSSYLGPFTTNGGNIYVTNSAAFTNGFFRLSF